MAWLRAITLVGVYGGLLMPLVFIPIVIFPFVFSKLIAFQILIGLTFPAYLMLAWMEPEFRPKRHILFAAVLSYFSALALSVIFASDPMRAWWGNQERMNGLFTLLHFLAWLAMATSLFKTEKDWRRLLNYEVAISVFMAIVAILQRPFPKLLLFPASARVGGLLDNPIYMAAYQIFNLFFIGWLATRTKNRALWAWYILAAGIDFTAFVLAQSRGGLLGLGTGLLVFAISFSVLTKNKKARWSIAGLIVLAFAMYGTLFTFRHTPIIAQSPVARLLDFSGSDTTRFIAWRIAWEGFLEKPLTGWGFDNFHVLFNAKYNPQSLRFGAYETWFDRSHNWVLDALAMTGLFGLLTFAFIFAALYYSVIRARRKGWLDTWTTAVLIALPLGYFTQNLFVFDHPAAFSMSYLLYAWVIAATRNTWGGAAGSEENADAKRRAFTWSPFIIFYAPFLLLVWRASALPFKASQLAIRSNSVFSQNLGVSYALAKQAADIPTPYLDEQAFLFSRNFLNVISQADFQKQIPPWKEIFLFGRSLLDRELDRHPLNAQMLFVAARYSHGFASYIPEEITRAQQRYQQAIKTSPKRQQLLYGLAQLYLQAKQPDSALEIYRQVRDFDPELGEGHWMYGLALMYDKQQRMDGAKEIVQSQTATYKYILKEQRELTPLMEAYLVMNDAEAIASFINRLPSLVSGSAEQYAQFAVGLDRTGHPDLRERVLAVGVSKDPKTAEVYKMLFQQYQNSLAPQPVKK